MSMPMWLLPQRDPKPEVYRPSAGLWKPAALRAFSSAARCASAAARAA
ncbi:hypothetical protein [Saccharopolyspora mangrovi]|uniref:Uncharacterized protein n=1 Tax=Saccharopolyspora mangrovi TaxID=3082379 RepID=A0ABU6AL24_9PSEU|nr:hypothetical protein [Saccharopolyspora sp. S2-29]MEB3372264.1 hypothetical protein [Saccharopolyspora sp. S2-29]